MSADNKGVQYEIKHHISLASDTVPALKKKYEEKLLGLILSLDNLLTGGVHSDVWKSIVPQPPPSLLPDFIKNYKQNIQITKTILESILLCSHYASETIAAAQNRQIAKSILESQK